MFSLSKDLLKILGWINPKVVLMSFNTFGVAVAVSAIKGV